MPLCHLIVCFHGALFVLLPLETIAQSTTSILECSLTFDITTESIDQCMDSGIEYNLYRSPTSGLTWCEGYILCQYQGQSLGVLATKRIQEYVTRLNMADGGRVWIAGRRKDYGSGWTWIDDALTDVSDNLTIYDRNNSSKDCSRVTLTRSGTKEITADFCDLPKAFICFSGLVTNPTLSWNEAMNYCVDNGSRLATLGEIITGHNGNSYWFGLKRRPWLWINQDRSVRPVLYSSWSSESGGDCMALLPNGSWTATPCTERLQYVLCQGELLPVTETTSAASTEQLNATTSTYCKRVITAETVIIVALAVILMVGVVLVVARNKRKGKGNPNQDRAATATDANYMNTVSQIAADRHGVSNEFNLEATTEYEPIGVTIPSQLPPNTEGQSNESDARPTAEYEQLAATDPIHHAYAPFTNAHPY